MALAAFNGAVAVAGSLSHAGGAVASYFALWSPTNNSWTTPLTVAGYAGAAFAVADFGGSLAVGGAFAYSTDGVTITTRFLFVYNPALGTAVAVPVPAITGTVNSAYINAMAVYQGVLIVAGTGVAGGLAQWDGSTWAASPLDGGVDASGSVYTMTVFNGSLIVGGVLTSVGAGVTAASVNGLARYDGTTWFPMPLVNSTGAVIASGPGYVYGLGVVNGHLLVGGDPSFSPVFMIWDGQGLQGMGQSTPPGGGTSFAAYCTPGSNLFGPDCAGVCPPCAHGGTCSDGVHGNGACACTPGWGGTTCDVCAPGHYGANCSNVCGACPSGAACNDGLSGDGTCHCAIGYLFYAGGNVCWPFPVASVGIFLGHGVNTWNGTAWAVAASTAGTMMAVASMDGYLYAGGNHVFSAYDGATLTDLTHVAGQTVTGEVMAMAKFQGSLAITGTLSFNQLSNPHGIIFGLWSNANQTWQLPLQGTAVNVAGYAVVEYRGHLIVGGSFQYSVAGNATVVTTYLLEYDPVAGTVAAIDASSIFEPGFGGGTIYALASYQGLLIVGGNPVVGGIAQWDGAARTWAASPLGGGLGYLDSSGLTVWALAVFNNDLIAGGSLTTAGAGAAGTVNITSSTARYNGVAWTNMPLSDSAIVQPSNYAVDALAVVNGHLFSGGDELTVGIWDGDVWQRMCQTDSSVVNVGNSFATFCAPGSLVYGPDCTGFCAACGPHGVCLDGMRGNGSCQCDAHWAGAVCDTCAPAWNGTACDACAANYFGPTCTPCQCSGHGACNDGLSGTGACTCTAHWTGTHCDACEANWTGALCDACTPGHYGAACAACPNCGPHGTCRDGVGGNGTCACAAGWAGALCNVCASGFYGPSCTPCACVHTTASPATAAARAARAGRTRCATPAHQTFSAQCAARAHARPTGPATTASTAPERARVRRAGTAPCATRARPSTTGPPVRPARRAAPRTRCASTAWPARACAPAPRGGRARCATPARPDSTAPTARSATASTAAAATMASRATAAARARRPPRASTAKSATAATTAPAARRAPAAPTARATTGTAGTGRARARPDGTARGATAARPPTLARPAHRAPAASTQSAPMASVARARAPAPSAGRAPCATPALRDSLARIARRARASTAASATTASPATAAARARRWRPARTARRARPASLAPRARRAPAASTRPAATTGAPATVAATA